MTTNTPPYRISYTQGPDGKVSIAVDISGPLPDPLDGMSPEERRAITRRSLSFSEYVTLWSVRHLPAAARQLDPTDLRPGCRIPEPDPVRSLIDAGPDREA